VDKLLLDFKSPFGRSNNFNNFLSKADKLVEVYPLPQTFFIQNKNQIYNVFFAQNRRYGKLVVIAKMEFNNQATITFIIITKYMIWK